jgi:hypothetical protein
MRGPVPKNQLAGDNEGFFEGKRIKGIRIMGIVGMTKMIIKQIWKLE